MRKDGNLAHSVPVTYSPLEAGPGLRDMPRSAGGPDRRHRALVASRGILSPHPRVPRSRAHAAADLRPMPRGTPLLRDPARGHCLCAGFKLYYRLGSSCRSPIAGCTRSAAIGPRGVSRHAVPSSTHHLPVTWSLPVARTAGTTEPHRHRQSVLKIVPS